MLKYKTIKLGRTGEKCDLRIKQSNKSLVWDVNIEGRQVRRWLRKRGRRNRRYGLRKAPGGIGSNVASFPSGICPCLQEHPRARERAAGPKPHPGQGVPAGAQSCQYIGRFIPASALERTKSHVKINLKRSSVCILVLVYDLYLNIFLSVSFYLLTKVVVNFLNFSEPEGKFEVAVNLFNKQCIPVFLKVVLQENGI